MLDLYKLYKLVVEKGGLVEVINKKIWREITKGLNLPSSITSAAFTLRTQYMKYLYPYECEREKLSNPAELQAAIDGNRREGRRPTYGSPSMYPAASANAAYIAAATAAASGDPHAMLRLQQVQAAANAAANSGAFNPVMQQAQVAQANMQASQQAHILQAANAQHAAAMAALEAIQNQQKHAAVANAQQQQVQQATAAALQHQKNNNGSSFSSPLFGRNNSNGENNGQSNPSTPTLSTFEELKRRLTESSSQQHQNAQNFMNQNSQNKMNDSENFSVPQPPTSSGLNGINGINGFNGLNGNSLSSGNGLNSGNAINSNGLNSSSLNRFNANNGFNAHSSQTSNCGPTPAKIAKLDFSSSSSQIATINQLQNQLANNRQNNMQNVENKQFQQSSTPVAVKRKSENAPNFSGLKLNFGGGKFTFWKFII